jgi:sugar O-acyltransferase (sialic acid O-acetyltransferase NeuD family)
LKNLIIIGAGGFGIEIYQLAQNSLGYNADFIIKGFIDDNLTRLDSYNHFPKILSTIDEYKINEDDVFIASIGNVTQKKIISQKIINKGGKFINIIHKSSILFTDLNDREGVFIGPNVTISSNCAIGNHVLIQTGAIVGHDSYVGDWTRLDSYVVVVGGVKIKNEVVIHTSAVINHNVVVEEGACIGALSFVIRNVKNKTTVFGNPARIL